jgi:hypothetical protein
MDKSRENPHRPKKTLIPDLDSENPDLDPDPAPDSK